MILYYKITHNENTFVISTSGQDADKVEASFVTMYVGCTYIKITKQEYDDFASKL